MIIFFSSEEGKVLALKTNKQFSPDRDLNALIWLFSGATPMNWSEIGGTFIGPRKEMITPWSSTAVEITRNMNIEGIERIEEFFMVKEGETPQYDKMLQRVYKGLNQRIFDIIGEPEEIQYITDIADYNIREGLALSHDEIKYLEDLSIKLGRALTDSEVFGFSQVNSEHCRHKIFNGTFIINGVEMESSLFKMIKKTSQINPNRIVSAYKDNCAFIGGPKTDMFYPASGDKPDFFKLSQEETVISLKAETHNFPTTVEPFNGAATGSGGEIRDRIAGGRGSFPLAGTAVYMTSYPRLEAEGRDWEKMAEREWLYQTPREILTKASNGASDFGNKFGQPVICGSLQTLEHTETDKHGEKRQYGFDKVIMLAGGVGFAKRKYAMKDTPETGDRIIVMGGDNYRIGMGGGAVSSVATGEYDNAIELNAIQRSNPEMQKRVYNTIRSVAESDNNPIVSVHDHGAGGHLNCLSELVEETGGNIDLERLPVGDPTLSDKEIIGNESQERMGMVVGKDDVERMRKIAERERAPFYDVGVITGENNFTIRDNRDGSAPINMQLSDFFGSTPKTVLTDTDDNFTFAPIDIDLNKLDNTQLRYYIEQVLQLESVACKDWLTNKVDRSVTGLVACQQTTGEIQLPLNNLGVIAIGYDNKEGIATSIGHAPVVAMIDSQAGSRVAIAEALTNIVWTPVRDGLRGISLSANWMWPAKNPGENARLYRAVKAASDFAIELGINIPTGKDSMSMTQKYPNGEKVFSPGTLIVSTVGESSDISKTIHPDLKKRPGSLIYYIPFSRSEYNLGGSAFAQILNKIGDNTIDIEDPKYFASAFEAIQSLVDKKLILAGHDISSGGLITTLLEMNFANTEGGLDMDISSLGDARALFSEKPAVIIQVASENREEAESILSCASVDFHQLGSYKDERVLKIRYNSTSPLLELDIDKLRDTWYKSSYLMERFQTKEESARKRYENYKRQPLLFNFPEHFTGEISPIKENERLYNAAIIREEGSNGDREMAWSLHMAGFNVKDVHVTDLIEGRENLEDISLIAFVGGFSNADTLGSAKGWAGAFLYNERAKRSLERFYEREDTLSLGVCNGCQLMGELGLITPTRKEDSPKLQHNDSGKYESAFVGVTIEESPSILCKSLTGSKLGIWVSHGEGKFNFPKPIDQYKVAIRYNYNDYPANCNGSPEGIAAVCSDDGRHLAMMPHPERAIRPWNWAHYADHRENDKVSPWIELFNNARLWLQEVKK